MTATPYKFSSTLNQEKGASIKATFKCLIITPDGKAFEDEVESVVAPGKESSFGILAKHAPFSALLKNGIVVLTKNNQSLRFEIGSGILEVNVTHEVLILCDVAKLVSPSTEAAVASH